MASYSTNEFKSGVKILLENDPYAILENEMVKPGKGQAFNRVRIRNLKSGRVIERTFKSGDTVEAADVVETEMQYLYADDQFYYFMNTENYEQIPVDKGKVGDANLYLKENDTCQLVMYGEEVIGVELPLSVEMTIVDTDPGFKGDTATGGSKPATTDTGLVVQVPLFVDIGTRIKVNTDSGSYIERIQ